VPLIQCEARRKKRCRRHIRLCHRRYRTCEPREHDTQGHCRLQMKGWLPNKSSTFFSPMHIRIMREVPLGMRRGESCFARSRRRNYRERCSSAPGDAGARYPQPHPLPIVRERPSWKRFPCLLWCHRRKHSRCSGLSFSREGAPLEWVRARVGLWVVQRLKGSSRGQRPGLSYWPYPRYH
jgi:hypothetical protein